jgi:hypothetical protein
MCSVTWPLSACVGLARGVGVWSTRGDAAPFDGFEVRLEGVDGFAPSMLRRLLPLVCPSKLACSSYGRMRAHLLYRQTLALQLVSEALHVILQSARLVA